MKRVTVIIVPGLSGSGEDHWQSKWQKKHPDYIWVQQDEWFTPSLEAWTEKLESVVSTIEGEIVLVPHSLGCITVAHWLKMTSKKISGIFFVAPADVESKTAPDSIKPFAPIPTTQIACPSWLIYSENDHYCTAERSELFAKDWQSHPHNIGEKGHINADSDIGDWIEGEELFFKFLRESGLR